HVSDSDSLHDARLLTRTRKGNLRDCRCGAAQDKDEGENRNITAFQGTHGFLLVMGLGGNNSTERQFDIGPIRPISSIIRPASAILLRSPQSGGHRMSRRITISF